MPEPTAFRSVPNRDLLILAGDIGTDMLARDFVLGELKNSPVIQIPGNHEYYSPRHRKTIDGDWRTLADQHPGLHYLTADSVTVGGIRFWGAPWYSDLWGTTDPWDFVTVHNGITDFWEQYNDGNTWSVTRHIAEHSSQTQLLRAEAGNVDVVITHWPPTKGALHPKFEGDSYNPYFINDHDDLVRDIGARLWVSGHTHEAFDYRVGGTRCIGNPAGYPGEPLESRLFRPDRTVEV